MTAHFHFHVPAFSPKEKIFFQLFSLSIILTRCFSAHFNDAFAFPWDFAVVKGPNPYSYFYRRHLIGLFLRLMNFSSFLQKTRKSDFRISGKFKELKVERGEGLWRKKSFNLPSRRNRIVCVTSFTYRVGCWSYFHGFSKTIFFFFKQRERFFFKTFP